MGDYALPTLNQSCSWVGSTHGPGRVRPGRVTVFTKIDGSGRIGSSFGNIYIEGGGVLRRVGRFGWVALNTDIRLMRYYLIPLRTTPKAFSSILNRMYWSIVSKAAERSRATTGIVHPCSTTSNVSVSIFRSTFPSSETSHIPNGTSIVYRLESTQGRRNE